MSMSVVGILISLVLLMYFAYRGVTVLILAPVVSLVAVVIGAGFDSHLMATYTEVFMVGFAGFVKTYFPLFLFGAMFGKLMDETGSANAIAKFVSRKLGAGKALLTVVVICALLTYGGVSLFVVVFVIYPVAASLFREANIPKRLVPGAIALGAFTFTMTALPGSPQIQNAIPMTFFKTNSYAAPVLGIIAAGIMFGLGMLWLSRRVKAARLAGEGYGDHKEDIAVIDESKLPGFWNAITPILIIGVVNFILSNFYYPHADGAYLKQYNTTLGNVSGIWSLVLASIAANIYILAANYKRLKDVKDTIFQGAKSSVLAIVNTCCEVGYGSVIKTLAGFAVIKGAILGVSGNPLITEALATNILCGITASASGGLSMALTALGNTYIQMANAAGISPEVLHRIASVASGGLDTLPHNGAVITMLGICGLTHKQSYKDVGMVSVVIPIVATTVLVILASLGLQC